ncbi:MAG: extracellular solute-binding protein [Clostridiales bacterium]|nr:extracellular solute-binding protein [Clostridiales bacterium]
MKKKALILIAALICLAGSCGFDSGKHITLTLWCANMDKEMIAMMSDEFLAAHPAVAEIIIEVCEDDKTRERFEENPPAAADVICIPHDQLGALVAQDRLAEISGGKYLAMINKNTSPSVYAGQIGGIQYGFPSSFETHMLFYDKSILSDSAVQNLESILSGVAPINGYQFAMDFANAYFTANWFFTYGCKLFGDSGEDSAFCDFNSPGGVAAMTYLIEHREYFGNLSEEAAIALFKEHRLGAYICGPWQAAAITEALQGNYGCARLPGVDGKDMKSFAGFKLYCINAAGKNKHAAMDLAAWLTKPDNQKTRFLMRNLIPVASSLVRDADVAVSATAQAVIAQRPYAIAMPSIPEMSNFWEPTGAFTLACYEGEIALAELPAKLNALISAIKGVDNSQ